MDGVTLAELRARRAALDEEIRVTEQRDREAWNTALDACESSLRGWLVSNNCDVDVKERKNELTLDIGHGALVVTFGCDGTQWARGLRMVSGRVLSMEWHEVPTPARLIAIVAVLLAKPAA